MKVIDLLNKIANREEVPKKIKFVGSSDTYTYTGKYYKGVNEERDEDEYFIFPNIDLDAEIEIIEKPKKIEKLDLYYVVCGNIKDKWVKENIKSIDNNLYRLENKINEVTDYINKRDNNE